MPSNCYWRNMQGHSVSTLMTMLDQGQIFPRWKWRWRFFFLFSMYRIQALHAIMVRPIVAIVKNWRFFLFSIHVVHTQSVVILCYKNGVTHHVTSRYCLIVIKFFLCKYSITVFCDMLSLWKCYQLFFFNMCMFVKQALSGVFCVIDRSILISCYWIEYYAMT